MEEIREAEVTPPVEKKQSNILTYIAMVLFIVWFLDAGYRVASAQSISQLFYYSSMGLLVTSIALYLRSSFLFTAMACTLLISESLWSISFLSNLFFHVDPIMFTGYAFTPHYDPIKFFLDLNHLLIVPSLLIGFKYIPIHPKGWIGSYLFILASGFLPYFFPDPRYNVNCVQIVTTGKCATYFYFSYNYLTPLRYYPLGLFVICSILALLFSLPMNYLLLFLTKKAWTK